MKRITVYLLLLFAGLSYGQAWQQMNDFPIEMAVHFSFSTQTHGYVMTRAIPNDTRMFKYDSAADSWVQINSFPVIATTYSTAVLDDIAYVLTGDNNIGEITIWRYDEPNDDWIIVTSAATGGNPICYSNAFFSVSGKLYVHVSQEVDNFRSYDPATDTWEILVDADAYGECITLGFSIGDKGYLLFSAQEVADVLNEELWEFDPSDGTWIQRPDYPGYTDETFDYPETIFVIDNLAYVGMTTLTGAFHRFDPVTNTWEAIQPCGYRGGNAAGFVIDGLGYVAGGNAFDPATGGTLKVDDVWKLDPEKLSITDAKEMGLVLYPNPADNLVLIKGVETEVNYSIYNLKGELLAKAVTMNQSIDISGLPTGMFLVAINSEEKSTVKKLLKL